MIAIESMALVALVEVWRRRKLRGMPICVTVGTELKLDLVQRVLGLGNMALRALQAGVPALEWIRARRMFFDPELGGLEPVDGMAGRTFASIGTLGELAAVRIRSMAICAFAEGNLLLEITLSMTLHAFDLGMLPEQWILRL